MIRDVTRFALQYAMQTTDQPHPPRAGPRAATPCRLAAASVRTPPWGRPAAVLALLGTCSVAIAAMPALPPDDAHWKQTCARVAAFQPPAADLPDAAQRRKLANCDALAHYDGLNGVPDYATARACAYTRLDHARDEALGPAAVLTMLYANGLGVRADLKLAQKFACEAGGADAEVSGRLGHLQAIDKEPVSQRKRFDFCDDITSGLMQGECTARGNRIDVQARRRRLAQLTGSFSDTQKLAFASLQRTKQAFFERRADAEVDQSGTGRAALVIAERAKLDEGFLDTLAAFEQRKLPRYDADDLRRADAALNAAYAKALKAAGARKPHDAFGPLGTIDANGIRTTERAWLQYRDAWVVFGRARYPDVGDAAWRTYFTRQRAAMLERLSDNGG